jgi:SAM-dependent methyltransferase
MPKYDRYQDYVIRDGKFVGEFEQMYRDFADPWKESSCEQYASEKAVGINLLYRLKAHHGIKRVIEVGCGFGHYSARLAAIGLDVVGIDISETAIATARKRHPGAEFMLGTLNDYTVFKRRQADVVVMAEVTWYVLDQLRGFLDFLRQEMPSVYLLHLLHTYAPGVQTFGTEYFTDLAGIKTYFGMRYLESGEVHYEEGDARTWFLGTWNAEAERAWNTSG